MPMYYLFSIYIMYFLGIIKKTHAGIITLKCTGAVVNSVDFQPEGRLLP